MPKPIRRLLGVPYVVYGNQTKKKGFLTKAYSYLVWSLAILGVCFLFEFFFPFESISKLKALKYTMPEWKKILVTKPSFSIKIA